MSFRCSCKPGDGRCLDGVCEDQQTPEWDLGTQIVITPPQGAVQILVRVPHPYDKDQVQVDYRQAPGETWTPNEFWDDTVQVNVG